MATRLLYLELIIRRGLGGKERRKEEAGAGRPGGKKEDDGGPPAPATFWSGAKRPCGIFLNPFKAF